MPDHKVVGITAWTEYFKDDFAGEPRRVDHLVVLREDGAVFEFGEWGWIGLTPVPGTPRARQMEFEALTNKNSASD